MERLVWGVVESAGEGRGRLLAEAALRLVSTMVVDVWFLATDSPLIQQD